MKKLVVAIVIFILVACFSLYLVLNKGHIGEISLVKLEGSDEETIEEENPELYLDFENEYLSATKKEKMDPIITLDDEEITEDFEIESSDEAVAKINDKNQVVAVSNGKATITVRYDGMEATKDIRVITPITSMTFTTTNSVVKVDKDLQMKLQLTPSDASTDTLVYSSSDEDVATVNQNGIVTGVSEGKVKITVYDTYTEKEKSVNLSIKEK